LIHKPNDLWEVIISTYYIHRDFTNAFGYLKVTFTIGLSFVTTFVPRLNLQSYVQIFNFGMTLNNKFEREDFFFVLRIGAKKVIEQITRFFNVPMLCLFIQLQKSSSNRIWKNQDP
jgi:hypothetical protein